MRPWCALLLASLAGPVFASNAASPTEAFSQGKFSLNARLRYEEVQQTGLLDGEALTLRARIGFTTAAWQGWKAMLEAEGITAADGDSYSQAGINAGGAGHAVIADPEMSEISQAWVAYSTGATTATLGRQRLVLDNARFIGDVGWRQNMQTFDAFVVQDKSLPKTTLIYAYLQQINRVFGPDHPQGKWQSDSHVFNASYAGWAVGTLTGYAYLLDFTSSAVNSCATYGASFAGGMPLTRDVKFIYRAEAATQSDYRISPLTYTAGYYLLEAGLGLKSASLTLGDEVLGSDHNVGFKTPLATLHAFNGWADLFLTTPAKGLRDTYIRATASLPGEISLLTSYHQFEAEVGGADFGHEFDVQFTRKFGPRVTALVKAADFRRDATTYPNVRKFWVQLEFAL
ncbi:MAG: alginate export family protein [Opitutaceae bacterium]